MHTRIAVVSLLVACTAAPPSDPPDAHAVPDASVVVEGPVDATTYCEEIAPFFCRFYLRCGRMAADDHASCLSLFAESCEGRYEPHYADLAASLLIELRREGIAACEAHLDAVACEDQVFDLDGPCASMWRGRQTEGNACGFDVESSACAPGTRCSLTLSLCGTCDRVVDVGDSCEGAGVTCAADATCKDGRCAARGRVGDTCDGFGTCGLGLSCGANGTCTGPERARVGEACDQARRCPYASTCVSGTCRAQARGTATCDPAIGCVGGRCADGSCKPLLEAGASCTQSAACESGMCLEGRCEAVPGRCFVVE